MRGVLAATTGMKEALRQIRLRLAVNCSWADAVVVGPADDKWDTVLYCCSAGGPAAPSLATDTLLNSSYLAD